MNKIHLEILPWVSSLLNAPASEWLKLEEEVAEGATIGDLLSALARSYPQFRQVVFNPDANGVSDKVMVVMNNRLLQPPDLTKTVLCHGDRVTLVPAYSRG